MKTIRFIVVAIIMMMAIGVHAQGISFHKVSFDEACSKAKEEGKMVFVDFYTQWCGPCKMLARNVFTQPEVGEYFNSHFVSIQLDAENEGKPQADKYEVKAYPTLYFLKADGSVVAKTVGAVGAEALLNDAKKAVEGMDDPDNLQSMKKQWEEKPHTEAFLEKYIAKMKDFHESPVEAIEEYLGVQTKMNEASSKMMEFLIDNDNYLYLGGNAERIYNANVAEYLDIATKAENRKVKQVHEKMMRHTRTQALADRNLAMYETFFDRWCKLKEKPSYQNYTELLLNKLMLQGNRKEYHRLGCEYLDSMVNSRSIEEIHMLDQQHYDEFCKTRQGQLQGMWGDVYRMSNKDIIAKIQSRNIIEVTTELLRDTSKKELKRIDKWVAHGLQLLENNIDMTLLEQKVLFVKGEREKAAEGVKALLASLNETNKNHKKVKEVLEDMEKGNIFNE
ncbi:MAG: thioredoxin family protein [Prevotella sp.]